MRRDSDPAPPRPRLPAEWEPHERTLMGFPCRPSAWGATFAQGRAESAAIANAIAAFEPVTLVCASPADAAAARPAVAAAVEITVAPMDGSWLRDNGPVYVVDGDRRIARHFRFNAWGERHARRDRDAALGRTLAEALGDEVTPVDVVLEGGAVIGDGGGVLALVEACVMHENRNWQHDRAHVEGVLRDVLGADEVLWLPLGLVQDREEAFTSTDGHIDLFAVFTGPRRCLLLAPDGPDDPNAETLADARAVLQRGGVEVVGFPYLPTFVADGREVIAPYLNLYPVNGGVVVPVAGVDPDMDADALRRIGAAFPGREVVGVHLRAHPAQGGAVHCVTQPVPRVGATREDGR